MSDDLITRLYRSGTSYRRIGLRLKVGKGYVAGRVRRLVHQGKLQYRGASDPISFGEHLRAQRLEADRAYQVAVATLRELVAA